MMNAIENLMTRRSIRTYKAEPVEKEKLDLILEAGIYAATGAGIQNVKLICVTKKEVRDQISKMNAAVMGKEIDPFYGAPIIIIALGDRSRTDKYVYDGSCALMNMMNAAHALGVGSCWIHRAKEEFESEEGKALLKSWGIEGDYEGIGHLAIGYNSGNDPEPKPREENRIMYVD